MSRPDWLHFCPSFPLTGELHAAFTRTLAEGHTDFLPAGVPRWVFLHWLTEQGFVLHGSAQPDIHVFQPRTPHDLSADEFSKRTGVFAASDPLWPLAFALADRTRVKRILSTALQCLDRPDPHAWGYDLSLAPRDPAVKDARTLLRPGSVYVLARDGFTPMPPYEWPGLGRVQESQWINPHAVTPLLRVPVTPLDWPLPIFLHDAERVDALCQSDPWGFPWLPGPA